MAVSITDIIKTIEETIVCVTCKNIIISGLNKCNAGHLYCNKCRMCKICDGQIQRKRKMYYCHNKGCNWDGDSDGLYYHKMTCKYNFIKCPVTHCKTKHITSHIFKHVTRVHGRSYEDLDGFGVIELNILKQPGSYHLKYRLNKETNDYTHIIVIRNETRFRVRAKIISQKFYQFRTTLRYKSVIQGRELILPVNDKFEWVELLNISRIDFNYQEQEHENWKPYDFIAAKLVIEGI